MSKEHDSLYQIKLHPEVNRELRRWGRVLPISLNRLGNIALAKFLKSVKNKSDWLDGEEPRFRGAVKFKELK